MLYFFIAAIVVAIDQGTKWFVVKYMTLGESIHVLGNFLYLTSHRNRGAAFGILQDQRWFFIVITLVIIIGIVYYLIKLKNEKKGLSWSLALILGGAVGNFIDRLLTGEVVDFIDVKITIGQFFYDYPIFNVADSALVIGVAILFIDTLRDSLTEMKHKKG